MSSHDTDQSTAHSPLTRREFLEQSAVFAAVAALGRGAPALHLRRTPGEPVVVAREAFARIERLADNVWAIISTPASGDRTTLSNGGIIAGRDAVLVIEAFNTPAGAHWAAAKAKELTGRNPSQIIITHYHSDHSNGVGGYVDAERHPTIRTTQVTRDLATARNPGLGQAGIDALRGTTLTPPTQPTTLDLGGTILHLTPQVGHTDSDVIVEVEDPHIVFSGDLFWNHLFPNYVDAIPSKLAVASRAVRRSNVVKYVPGHGVLADDADLSRYLTLIDAVETAARDAHAKGIPLWEAGTEFKVPPGLIDVGPGTPTSVSTAFRAWQREFSASS